MDSKLVPTRVTSLQATVTGHRVLAALDRGRALAILQAKERGARTIAEVVILINADRAAGRSTRGMAGRISRKMGLRVHERHIRRIISGMLSSMAGSRRHNEINTGG